VRQEIGPEGARALAKTRYMTALHSLSLSGNSIGPDGVRALVTGPWSELKGLSLSSCKLADAAALTLAESGRLTALVGLDLEYNQIGLKGVAALCRAEWLSGLVNLYLVGNSILDKCALELCKSTVLKNLKTIHGNWPFDKNHFSPEVAEALKKRFGDKTVK
jgi:hypothetical protein